MALVPIPYYLLQYIVGFLSYFCSYCCSDFRTKPRKVTMGRADSMEENTTLSASSATTYASSL